MGRIDLERARFEVAPHLNSLAPSNNNLDEAPTLRCSYAPDTFFRLDFRSELCQIGGAVE